MHVLLVVSGMVWVAAAVILAVVILHRYGWGYTRVSTKHEQKSSNLGTPLGVWGKNHNNIKGGLSTWRSLAECHQLSSRQGKQQLFCGLQSCAGNSRSSTL
jgi:hypothetical protein